MFQQGRLRTIFTSFPQRSISVDSGDKAGPNDPGIESLFDFDFTSLAPRVHLTSNFFTATEINDVWNDLATETFSQTSSSIDSLAFFYNDNASIAGDFGQLSCCLHRLTFYDIGIPDGI